jgi:hypothetical protein
MAWEPALVGTWQDTDDRLTVRIEAAEWRSYRLHYDYPSEKGDLTGYLTARDGRRYLDVMPLRGTTHGSFLLPVHAVLRLTLDGDELTLAPLSYDWFATRLRRGGSPGVAAVFDELQNVLLTAPTVRLRRWLRGLPDGSPAWDPPAHFVRVFDNPRGLAPRTPLYARSRCSLALAQPRWHFVRELLEWSM